MSDVNFFLTALEAYVETTPVPAAELIACLDLTSLNSDDREETIHALCVDAQRYSVAAVCVNPEFVSLARQSLQPKPLMPCQVATVANFPSGAEPRSHVLQAIERSLIEGATEIDVVVPYQRFLVDTDGPAVIAFVKACKALCGPKVKLKTILESGLVEDKNLLERLALCALEGGSDSLKTSTGKVAQGASLAAAVVMFGALKAFGDPARGFKAAGGVRTYDQAKAYWLLAKLVMGEHWPKPDCFRLGASVLLKDLVARLPSG